MRGAASRSRQILQVLVDFNFSQLDEHPPVLLLQLAEGLVLSTEPPSLMDRGVDLFSLDDDDDEDDDGGLAIFVRAARKRFSSRMISRTTDSIVDCIDLAGKILPIRSGRVVAIASMAESTSCAEGGVKESDDDVRDDDVRTASSSPSSSALESSRTAAASPCDRRSRAPVDGVPNAAAPANGTRARPKIRPAIFTLFLRPSLTLSCLAHTKLHKAKKVLCQKSKKRRSGGEPESGGAWGGSLQ